MLTREETTYRHEFEDPFVGYIINSIHSNLDGIVRRVLDCQSSLLLKDVQPSQDELEHGFLIHRWSFENLKELLLPFTSSLLCLIDKNQQKLAGYQVLTSINNFLQYLDPVKGKLELISGSITDEEWSHFISMTDVHYLEQTGVSHEYRRRGVATCLICMAKSLSLSGLCTFVLDWPHTNLPSDHSKIRNGFRFIALWKGDTGTNIGFIQSKLFIWNPS